MTNRELLQQAFNILTNCDKLLAITGLDSYRCKGRYGWIMIGALNTNDAMNEARRSSSDVSIEGLQKWSKIHNQYEAI